jgi:hypothetical protein
MSSAKDRGELTITLRMKGRPVVLVGEGGIADEHRSLLKRAGAFIVAEGSKAAFAVVVDDPAAVSRLKVRGCLVYAVGQPELSDFAFASPAPSSKAARKAESTPAKLYSPEAEPEAQPEPQPEPDLVAAPASAPMLVTPKVRKPPAAAKPPKAPRPERPRPERPPIAIKMPQVSFEPVLRAARATGQLAQLLWVRTKALVAPMLGMSTPFTRTIVSNIQDRIDRARERPISLDLALVKGGLLDHEVDSTKPDRVEPAAIEGQDNRASAGAADPAQS